MIAFIRYHIVHFFGHIVYNRNMNKQRLIRLIEILRKKTDMDHKLSIQEISALLEEEGIPSVNRKTLYDDFRSLEGMGLEVEYDHGYYLSEAPFSVSEIKIIIDSLNSLRDLDDSFLEKLKDKLYSFLSDYETEELKQLEYHCKHKDLHFINRLEDALNAIRNGNELIITRNGRKQSEVIAPLFLYRLNDYYYLYYHYENSDKIYHMRFDNIRQMKLTEKRDEIPVRIDQVISDIEESSSGFHSSRIQTIRFRICEESEYLRQRLRDDFANLTFTKDGFFIKTSISDAFFARLSSYSDKIKISDPEVAEMYLSFLERIIIRNKTD